MFTTFFSGRLKLKYHSAILWFAIIFLVLNCFSDGVQVSWVLPQRYSCCDPQCVVSFFNAECKVFFKWENF
jgi:hypothetical protein